MSSHFRQVMPPGSPNVPANESLHRTRPDQDDESSSEEVTGEAGSIVKYDAMALKKTTNLCI